MKTISRRNFFATSALALICALLTTTTLRADEIKVVTSGAFTAAYLELAPEYERTTHNKLVTEFGASMGTTHRAIPMRLERGEAIDVVIMSAPALADLIEQGKVRADSRVDLVQSSIGMAVKAGAPRPDISTIDALKHALLAAKSIAYSDSVSGVYLSTELFPALGIADQIKGKTRMIEADPVGEAVARGEVEIGFQQVSELLPVKGIDNRWRAAARGSEGDCVCSGHPRIVKASGGSPGVHPVACITSRLRCYNEERFGAHEIQVIEVARLTATRKSTVVTRRLRSNLPPAPDPTELGKT